MKIYTSLAEIENPFPKPCVTIGNFDGVHLGHQLLFREVVERSRRCHGVSVVITFEPHPLKLLCPERGIKLISTFEQKLELIGMANIDVLIVLPFTRELAGTPAETFVNEVLIRTVGVHELVIGYDYAMGRGRQGNIEFLKGQGMDKGFPVTVVEPLYVDEMLVSSSKIRELVAEGRMRAVKNLLGRPYQIRGEVQRGKQRGGREVGFPTANLHLADEDLCPKHGVYVTQVIYDGKCYGGVLNIGYNPTFGGEQHISAETHIFDFNQDIYGKPIKINLLQYLRGERKFNGVTELSNQIARDIERAKKILAHAQKALLLSCGDRYNR